MAAEMSHPTAVSINSEFDADHVSCLTKREYYTERFGHRLHLFSCRKLSQKSFSLLLNRWMCWGGLGVSRALGPVHCTRQLSVSGITSIIPSTRKTNFAVSIVIIRIESKLVWKQIFVRVIRLRLTKTGRINKPPPHRVFSHPLLERVYYIVGSARFLTHKGKSQTKRLLLFTRFEETHSVASLLFELSEIQGKAQSPLPPRERETREK